MFDVHYSAVTAAQACDKKGLIRIPGGMARGSTIQLSPENHVLSSQAGPAGEERPQERQDHPQDAHLRPSMLPQRATILRQRSLPRKNRNIFGIKVDRIIGRDRPAEGPLPAGGVRVGWNM
jgi:hypothetical protein